MADGAKKPIKIIGNDSLATRVAAFQKKAEEHKAKQKINPFSEWADTTERPVWDKNDPRYGRPIEGSKTEKRGIQAGQLISGEVQLLCDLIYQYGHPLPDGKTVISFGELFEMYTRISNKVVGILMRARKHGLLTFEGEMLFQRRDDHVVITLIKTIEELHEIFGIQGPIPTRKRCEEVEDDDDDVTEKRYEDEEEDVAFLDITNFNARK
ncbi:actin-binding Rho-activating protein-like [Centruroides vittatus]|uniref:actin-binding Rho-activating protein-like n=1 Tax=Centruroides vittatus TaxID=120091 RepID=UPI00350F0C38